MVAREQQGMHGTLTMEVRNELGRLVDRRVVENLITDNGRRLVARLFAGAIKGKPTLYIVVGTGGAEPTRDDVSLVEVDRAIASAVSDGNRTTVRAVFTPRAQPQTLTEAGIVFKLDKLDGLAFPGSPASEVLYNRVTFAVVHSGSNMELTLSWDVVF